MAKVLVLYRTSRLISNKWYNRSTSCEMMLQSGADSIFPTPHTEGRRRLHHLSPRKTAHNRTES